MSELEPITDQAAFEALLEEISQEEVFALDTEFHRERTYFPKVALLQLGWRDQVALVDPLAVDIGSLGSIFESGITVVIHAASQDLEVLLRSCGRLPEQLFDTQIAAGFLGMSAASLAAAVERELGFRLPKSDRLTDWLQRPLTEGQLSYAAADVAHLLALWRLQVEKLTSRGRLSWAEAEFGELRRKIRVSRDPGDAWLRIKEARQLRGRSRGVARAVAAWREERAVELDQPVRFILADIAVVTIAQRAPKTLDELRAIRGVDDRHARGESGRALLAAVERGLNEPVPEASQDPNGEVPRDLRPAVSLLSTWISQIARDEELDTAVLATRADLEALLRGDAGARLAEGWRAELVGGPIRRVLEGSAALAFDRDRGLVLEERSRNGL